MALGPNGVYKKVAAILNTATVVPFASPEMFQLQAGVEQQLGIPLPLEQDNRKLQPRLPALLYQSENKDFVNHIGWRLEVDAVWFHQSK